VITTSKSEQEDKNKKFQDSYFSLQNHLKINLTNFIIVIKTNCRKKLNNYLEPYFHNFKLILSNILDLLTLLRKRNLIHNII
jgi:hypothetical protein